MITILYRQFDTDIDASLALSTKTGHIIDQRNGYVYSGLGTVNPSGYQFCLQEIDNVYVDGKHTAKRYHILMKFDAVAISAPYYSASAKLELLNRLVEIETHRLKMRHKYQNVPVGKLGLYIQDRNANNITLSPWWCMQITTQLAISLKSMRILHMKRLRKNTFARYGGIIITNDINQTIVDHFSDSSKYMMVTKSHIKNRSTISRHGKKRIVLCDLDENDFMVAKKIIYHYNPSHVWILSTKPIHYINRSKRFMGNLCNIWGGFDTKIKPKITNELMKFVYMRISEIYVRVSYQHNYPNICINASPLENVISQKYKEYVNNWTNGLTYQQHNQYSIASHQKITRIKKAAENAIVGIAMSVMPLQKCRQKLKITWECEDTTCPVCYNDNPQVLLACGHMYCVDCAISSMAINNKCPMCNAALNISNLTIVSERTSSLPSNLLSFLKNIDMNTIVITDLQCMKHYLPNVIHIDDDISRPFHRFTKILMISSPHSDIDAVTGCVSKVRFQYPHLVVRSVEINL